jgi:hypothetical protein
MCVSNNGMLLNFLLQRRILVPRIIHPDLAPTYFNLFGALKNAIPGKRFESHDEVNEEMKM